MTLSVGKLCVALCRLTAECASSSAHPRNNNFERPRCISRQFNRGLGFAILELAQLLSVCDSQFRPALVSFPAVVDFLQAWPCSRFLLSLYQPNFDPFSTNNPSGSALPSVIPNGILFNRCAAADMDGVIQATVHRVNGARPATTARASCWR